MLTALSRLESTLTLDLFIINDKNKPCFQELLWAMFSVLASRFWNWKSQNKVTETQVWCQGQCIKTSTKER